MNYTEAMNLVESIEDGIAEVGADPALVLHRGSGSAMSVHVLPIEVTPTPTVMVCNADEPGRYRVVTVGRDTPKGECICDTLDGVVEMVFEAIR